jgi:hypothetical protein
MFCKSLDVLCSEEKATVHRRSPIPEVTERRQPPWHPTIQCIRNSQNVAGLWLKYGVKSLKYETSAPCKILVRETTFVDDNR